MGSEKLTSNAHFNLIPLLNALLKTESVSLAARELGISQPAASQGLARLRTQMHDPLLVSIGGKMQLTPFAAAIAGRLDLLVTEMDGLLHSLSFDPAQSTRPFTIATADYTAYLLAMPIVKLVQEHAPKTEIRLVELGVDLAHRMAAREIDFALLPHFSVLYFTSATLRYRSLLQDPPVVMMDCNHPLASRTKVSIEDLNKYKHVVFQVEALERTAPNRRHSNLFTCSEELIAIQTDLVSLIPRMLRGTEMVSILTDTLASELCENWKMAIRPLENGPENVNLGIAWSPVFDADPAHLWLRKKIELINRVSVD